MFCGLTGENVNGTHPSLSPQRVIGGQNNRIRQIKELQSLVELRISKIRFVLNMIDGAMVYET